MAKVVILGGGIGGLSAAHELVERGFQVSVYERRDDWGGKARSYGVPETGVSGRRDLPAEHGFRLFPGFYRHLPDTMKRIPFRENARGVFDNLVPTSRMEVARETAPPSVTAAHFPKTLDEWRGALESLFSFQGISPEESRFFAGRALVVLTSCQERRLAEYERYSWWQFVEADGKSEAYQKLLGDGLIRRIFAVQGREASARTMANTGIQILLDEISPARSPLRVLDGPQTEVWLDPWVRYLCEKGVQLCSNAELRRLNLEDGRIRSATVRTDGQEVGVEADYFVCAVPIEVMRRMVTPEIAQAAPSLAHLDQLHTEWKVGIQFYLRRDVPVLPGYVIYADANWGLLSLSQHQFWSGVQLSDYGSGEVQGILSVDICDWRTPGNKVVFKPADQCTADEIAAEVWAQIKAHLNRADPPTLQDEDLLAWHLDTSIRFPPSLPQEERNVEPLLVNTAGSWQHRPEADLSNGLFRELPNLFLAADYVRTYTDAATMEGANEAARRAVNGILQASGSRAAPCGVWPLEEPALFAPLRAYDYTRFKLGYPHALPLEEPVRKSLPAVRRLASGAGRERLREWNHYQFEERWRVAAPPEAVWALVAEPSTYPHWWRQFPRVRRLNDLPELGAEWELHIKSALPYPLHFVAEVIRYEAPTRVEWRARGDLEGRMEFRLQPVGNGTELLYTSDLRTRSLLLNGLAPLAKRLFEWNHEAAMKRGQEELQAALRRQSVGREHGQPLVSRSRLIGPGQGFSVRAGSSLVTFKAIGQDTRGAFSLFEVEDGPQSGPPAHRFEWMEGAIYILEGKYALQVGDHTFTATAGSFVFLPRGVWHDWKNVGPAPGRVLLIAAPAGVESYFEEVSRLPPGPPDVARLMVIGRKYGTEVRVPVGGNGWSSVPEVLRNGAASGLYLAPGQGTAFRALGSLITFKAMEQDTHGAYSLCEVCDPPQGGQPSHCFHAIDGTAYILEGNYLFQVNGRTFTAPPGSLVRMPRGVWHHWNNVGATPGRVLEIASPAGLEKLIAEVAQMPSGPLDRDRLLAISQKYDAEVSLSST